jgi:hypothetical protein
MKVASRILTTLLTLALLVGCAPWGLAQNPANFGAAAGRYGLTSWSINNQRVASNFNYDIDSIYRSGLGSPLGDVDRSFRSAVGAPGFAGSPRSRCRSCWSS